MATHTTSPGVGMFTWGSQPTRASGVRSTWGAQSPSWGHTATSAPPRAALVTMGCQSRRCRAGQPHMASSDSHCCMLSRSSGHGVHPAESVLCVPCAHRSQCSCPDRAPEGTGGHLGLGSRHAWLFCQCLRAAVSTPGGGAPRHNSCSASWQSSMQRQVGSSVSWNLRRWAGGVVLCCPWDRVSPSHDTRHRGSPALSPTGRRQWLKSWWEVETDLCSEQQA